MRRLCYHISTFKKVLPYNKVGGYRTESGIAHLNQYMFSLAQTKGLTIDPINTDTAITLEFLKQYQVLIWNNNFGAVMAVPAVSAQESIVEYVNQGGGWFLIGLAVDHFGSWPALADRVGASFTRWGGRGDADMQVDSSAQNILNFGSSSTLYPMRFD